LSANTERIFSFSPGCQGLFERILFEGISERRRNSARLPDYPLRSWSAEHRPGARPDLLSIHAETVLGAPIAEFKGARRDKYSGILSLERAGVRVNSYCIERA
jgi:hypothetical protein